MELENIRFEISNSGKLETRERLVLLSAYKELFVKIYGYDILTEFYKENNRIPKRVEKTFNVLKSVKENEDLSLILIYYGKQLIGGGRIRKLSDTKASVPDIAIEIGTDKEKREIWKMTVEYVEQYLLNNGFEKMYLEVPLKEAPLLYRAGDLGFIEDPKDIGDDNRTYLLNKDLVRNKDEQFNSSRK